MNNNTIEIQKEFKNFLSSPIPISEQKWNKDTMPLVSISCITYNHENYIRDAIEGFLMQETTFPVEILIHDDASTDGTANIIRKYEQKFPNLIKPIYQKENQYSKQDGTIGHIQRNRAKGKYYALCEGDDYWIDPLKLQKQVDFLEKNESHSLISSNYSIYYEKNKKLINNNKTFPSRISFIDIYKANPLRTTTVLMKNNLIKELEIELQKTNIPIFDFTIFLWASLKGEISMLNDNTAVYRYHHSSITHNRNIKSKLQFEENKYVVRKYFLTKFYPNRDLEIFANLNRAITGYKLCIFYDQNREYISSEREKILSINKRQIPKKYYIIAKNSWIELMIQQILKLCLYFRKRL